MADFLKQLKQLKKALESANGSKADDSDDSDDSDDAQKKMQIERICVNEKLSSTIHLLYSASKVRIYKIADKIEKCAVPADQELYPESKMEIPVAESWDFRLGDKVRIKKEYTVEDFKYIQTSTLGWNARLRSIYDCVGIVTSRSSCYENSVAVYAPARFSVSSLYAGVLEKVPADKDDDPVSSRWKVNEYVTTKVDQKVVQLMQRQRKDIPTKYLGRKGRIIAVTRVAVVVTFNERTSYDINSYLLVRCPDQSPIEVVHRAHDRGFKAGDKVQMISNFTKLISNQKNKGGWNDSMSKLAGKEVRIIQVHKDGTLDVQRKLGRTWRVNSDSVMKSDEVSHEIKGADAEFVRQDIVKIRRVENIRMLLENKFVPLDFLEYLRSTAVVKLLDDDLDYLIRYNCDQNVSAYADTVRRATADEIQKHNEIKDMEKQIEVKSEVYLDVGPPNFVRAVLTEVQAPPEVIRAMTRPSVLVGFAKDNRAVIECEDGKRYKIKKKFLTVPDKFNVHDKIEGLDFNVAKEIQEMVATCVQILHDDQSGAQKSTVKILSMSYSTPSTVDLRVYSAVASFDKICELLMQMCEWDVEISCAGTFYVRKMQFFPDEVKVSVYFNDEDYVLQKMPSFKRAVSINDMKLKRDDHKGIQHEEAAAAEQLAVPTHGVAYVSNPGRAQEEPLRVENLEEFRYLSFSDPSLSTSFYIPYIVRDQSRTPTDPAFHAYYQKPHNVTNIYNIDSVDSINN